MSKAKDQDREIADAFIGAAQALEDAAKAFRREASGIRSGRTIATHALMGAGGRALYAAPEASRELEALEAKYPHTFSCGCKVGGPQCAEHGRVFPHTPDEVDAERAHLETDHGAPAFPRSARRAFNNRHED